MSHEEISKPSSWFRRIKNGEIVEPEYDWDINKEKIYDIYKNKFKIYYVDGKRVATGFDDAPPIDGIFHHEEVLLPNGEYMVPIRQFCDTRILPEDQNEAHFFKLTRLIEPDFNEPEKPTQAKIDQISKDLDYKGARITVGYQNTEESEIDIIASTNRAFSLESINDETKQVLNTTNNSLWINNLGETITNDYNITPNDKLTINTIIHARNKLECEGFNTSNLVLYTTPEGFKDIITSDSKLNALGVFDLERILGMKIIITNYLQSTLKYTKEKWWQKLKRFFLRKQKQVVEGDGKRSVLFIPKLSFGLVLKENLKMRAEKKEELQAINITGIQQITSLLKEPNSCVMISHA